MEDAPPAYWLTLSKARAYSFYASEEDAMKELMFEAEYKEYFE